MLRSNAEYVREAIDREQRIHFFWGIALGCPLGGAVVAALFWWFS